MLIEKELKTKNQQTNNKNRKENFLRIMKKKITKIKVTFVE
jgi:hypothetical protein